jgi:hypothetical protein
MLPIMHSRTHDTATQCPIRIWASIVDHILTYENTSTATQVNTVQINNRLHPTLHQLCYNKRKDSYSSTNIWREATWLQSIRSRNALRQKNPVNIHQSIQRRNLKGQNDAGTAAGMMFTALEVGIHSVRISFAPILNLQEENPVSVQSIQR